MQRTPLLEASGLGSAELVELLLSRGADIKAVDEDGDTVLALASCNGMHGPAIIPLLAKAGVDVNDSDGESALVYGLDQNGSIMHALAPLYPQGRQLAGFRPPTTCPDPIGCIREAVPFGCSISSGTFDLAAQIDSHILHGHDAPDDHVHDVSGQPAHPGCAPPLHHQQKRSYSLTQVGPVPPQHLVCITAVLWLTLACWSTIGAHP